MYVWKSENVQVIVSIRNTQVRQVKVNIIYVQKIEDVQVRVSFRNTQVLKSKLTFCF